MTLTVPQAGTTAGRAAEIRVEAPDTGAIVAEFGEAMLGVGTRLETDRLDRQMRRLRVDMTRDLGDLRLRAEEIGDPDELDAFWQQGVQELRQSYLTGTDARGRPRVDRKIAADWQTGFDDLANRHAFAVGQTGLALRQSQRAATFADYEQVAGQQAALVDPDTRAALYADYDASVDDMVARGMLTPEAGGEKKRGFRADAESASLTGLIAEDPEAVIEGIDAGAWPGLTAGDQAAWRAKAGAALAAREEATARAAEVAAKEASAQTKADLKTAIGIAGKGQFSAYEAMADDPAVTAEFPDLAAELKGTLALRDEGKVIAAMPLPELRKLSAELGRRELTAAWQVKQKEAVDKQIEVAAKAYGEGGDPIAHAQSAGLPVPALDIAADGQTLARGIAARARFGDWLEDKGYSAAPALLSEAERVKLSARIAETADPAGRAGIVLALTAALPREEALRLAGTAGASAGFRRAIGLVADGADPASVLPMLRGEQKLAAGVASAPPPKQSQMVFAEVTGATLDGSVPAMAEIYRSASAIFADGMGATDPEAMADGLMIDGPAREKWVAAIQQAAGAMPDRNDAMTVGGFQEVAGRVLLLPRGVAAEAANEAVSRIGAQLAGHDIYSETLNVGRIPIMPRPDAPPKPDAPPERDPYRDLKAASLNPGAAPDLGPDPATAWRDLRIERIEGPVGQDAYVLVREHRGLPFYVEDAEGRTYAFSLEALIAGASR